MRGTQRFGAAMLAVLAGLALASCSKSKPAATKSFPTPEAAMQALVVAVEQKSEPDLEAIVGKEMRDALRVDDASKAVVLRTLFLRGAKERVSFEPNPDHPEQRIAFVGENEWPFPAPLVPDGKNWRFDGAAGVEEVRYRRIGRHELFAIEACRAYVDAQQEYAQRDRDGDGVLEFATRVNSSPGKNDGLYWDTAHGQDLSPLGPFAAQAIPSEVPATAKPEPLAGYFYRILTAQGANAPGGVRDLQRGGNLVDGFGLIAWPAEYGETGFKTFIVNQQGQVLEKDMGGKTETLVASITAFNPDPSWTPTTD